jgi:hypothetical protein
MAFRGKCLVDSVGIISDGKAATFLKAVDGSFDWTPFIAKQGQEREFLAIALAAITSNKPIDIQTETTTQWSEVSLFFISKQ